MTAHVTQFMGQRFVPDAYIFRELIWRNVGTPAEPRMLPSGLDVMATLGSDRAYEILAEMGETTYQNYPEQMEKMRAWTGDLTEAEWTETLYHTWLYSFLPLLEPPGDSLLRLEELAVALQGMAEKQLRGEPLTAEENDRLRFYGGELEHLTMAAADTDAAEPFTMPVAEEEPQAAVIADVATAPDPGRTVSLTRLFWK